MSSRFPRGLIGLPIVVCAVALIVWAWQGWASFAWILLISVIAQIVAILGTRRGWWLTDR
jgi:hypothetical protein